MKKSIFILSFVFVLVGLSITYLQLTRHWLYSEEIVENICVKQKFRENVYDLVLCDDAKPLVEDVNGWIIDNQLIYGSMSETGYFAISLSRLEVTEFESIHDINSFLFQSDVRSYDMNDEENISHLKYGGNRKYGK
jgi:hypothetical protein